MNKTMHRRMTALQAQADLTANAGCDTCRHYPGIVIRDDAGNMSRPEVCPDCGREVPIFRLIHIAGVPLETP
jgi:hypothetical protein